MSYSATLTVPTEQIALLKAWVDESVIRDDLDKILRKFALTVLRALILTCSVDTGRARGGFLALFEKLGVSPSDVMESPSPYQTGRMTASKQQPGSGVSEGLAMGSVLMDQPGHILVANAVEYVEFINSGTKRMHGTHFIDMTWQQAYDYMPKLANWYLDARLANAGFRPSVDPVEGPGDIL
jgi:hypothetical protein